MLLDTSLSAFGSPHGRGFLDCWDEFGSVSRACIDSAYIYILTCILIDCGSGKQRAVLDMYCTIRPRLWNALTAVDVLDGTGRNSVHVAHIGNVLSMSNSRSPHRYILANTCLLTCTVVNIYHVVGGPCAGGRGEQPGALTDSPRLAFRVRASTSFDPSTPDRRLYCGGAPESIARVHTNLELEEAAARMCRRCLRYFCSQFVNAFLTAVVTPRPSPSSCLLAMGIYRYSAIYSAGHSL